MANGIAVRRKPLNGDGIQTVVGKVPSKQFLWTTGTIIFLAGILFSAIKCGAWCLDRLDMRYQSAPVAAEKFSTIDKKLDEISSDVKKLLRRRVDE